MIKRGASDIRDGDKREESAAGSASVILYSTYPFWRRKTRTRPRISQKEHGRKEDEMVEGAGESDMLRKHCFCRYLDNMKRRRRWIAGWNGTRECSYVSQPMFLRSRQVVEINWVAGDIHGAPLDVASTVEAHSVGAWSFVFAVFPGIKEQGYEDLVRERKNEAP